MKRAKIRDTITIVISIEQEASKNGEDVIKDINVLGVQEHLRDEATSPHYT